MQDGQDSGDPAQGGRWQRFALGLGLPLLVIVSVLGIAGARYAPVLVDYFDGESCIGCHRGGFYADGDEAPAGAGNDRIVVQWLGSAHFGADVGCEDCHGSDHEKIFAANGTVSAKVCGGCHEAAEQEFARSSHARAEAVMKADARFQAVPEPVKALGCVTCHDIGRSFADGGKGQCNYCHSGHRFSAAEARRPEACQSCHMGPNHPQMEAWEASKHGLAWRALEDESTAPTCVTCHMGGAGGHDDHGGLTLGRASVGAVMQGDPQPIPMPELAPDTFAERRERMLSVCRRCHGAKFAQKSLEQADALKKQADALVGEAAQIIRDLYDAALLEPMPEDRPPHPIQGHAMVLGGDQLYQDSSAIEQRFFSMVTFHHATTFKGAYHQSPDHVHWLGWVQMQADLTWIRSEARRLRAAHRHEARD